MFDTISHKTIIIELDPIDEIAYCTDGKNRDFLRRDELGKYLNHQLYLGNDIVIKLKPEKPQNLC